MTQIKVFEWFQSIQGEGSLLGVPATFVRLPGCNLACEFCDTKDSWTVEATRLTIDDILAICANLENVIITGGEPCIHPQLPELVDALKAAGHYVCLETNGTLPTPENTDWIVVSPKPPIYAINPKCRVDELKIVVTDDKVLEYIENTILSTDSFNVPVWLQPNGYDMAATARKAYEFILRHPNSQLKLGVQLHKIYDFK